MGKVATYMSSKIFSVTVIQCADSSHAEKIAKLLRKSFRHRLVEVNTDKPSPASVGGMVQAESSAAIQAALSPALGAAKCFCGEMSFLGTSGILSPMPPDSVQFAPPVNE
jgi:hypothetical protein